MAAVMSTAAFSMVMTTAAVSAMVMAFTVMTALNIRVKIQFSGNKCFNRYICFTGNSTIKSDACLCKSILRSAPNTSAD